MAIIHDPANAFEDPGRNSLFIETRYTMAFVGSIQPRVGQPMSRAYANREQAVFGFDPV